MSDWTPVENPGTHPLRSWAFGIGCALLAAVALDTVAHQRSSSPTLSA